ncbi:unnamed protein product [Mycena citricolor]|uniref:pH-response regulator protein palC n=1 Tax=Mycena citricolor TaxID=2018698 RepID=A0AAD2HY75_9AGAR|nr:unnamed protein product [Mycena citricolor]CAK5284406.1 unnamed protein product [Mycena citricolor]
MSLYLYELPTTGAISFSEFCSDTTPDNAHTIHLSDTTQTRANLRGILKETKRTQDDDKDYLRLVKVLDEYLPKLRGIIVCVAGKEMELKSEPTFSWRTTLSANLFKTSPRLSIPSLHGEHAYSLLTYAYALSNLAKAKTTALGNYEHDRGISDADRKAKDNQLTVSADLLCRASGVFSYISTTVLIEWENAHVASAGDLTKPPDLTQEVNSALAKLSLADAQTLAIRKLLSRSIYDSYVAPGPPLPKSHPSPALISKLHLECSSLYGSALTLSKTLGSTSKSRFKPSDEVSSDLRRYLTDEAAFHNAMAHKWLGIDAGENGGTDRGGEAVALLAWAKKDLEELKSRRKDRVIEELAGVNVFLKHYKKVNDSLHFQPVPTQSELQVRIPAGRLVLSPKPFQAPQPAFGPGSIDGIRRQTGELEVDDGPASASYAGAGSYF